MHITVFGIWHSQIHMFNFFFKWGGAHIVGSLYTAQAYFFLFDWFIYFLTQSCDVHTVSLPMTWRVKIKSHFQALASLYENILQVFGMWDEARIFEENPCKHGGENMQNSRVEGQGSNPELSNSASDMLTTRATKWGG